MNSLKSFVLVSSFLLLFVQRVYSDFWVEDELLGWANQKSFKAKVPPILGFPAFYVQLNKQGGRDTIDWDNLRDKKKILILGDSVCFGFGINFEETFGELIEKKLGEYWISLNLSVVGYSTDQQLLMLEREGLKYNPDIVVFCLWVNDIPGILDSSPLENGGRGKPVFVLENGELVLRNVPPKSVSTFPDIYNKMFLLTYGRYALNYYLGDRYDSFFGKIKGYLYLFEDKIAQVLLFRMVLYKDVMKRYIDLLKSMMRKAKNICPCEIYLILIPDYDQALGRKPYVDKIYDMIESEISPIVGVVKVKLSPSDFFVKNLHPNAIGHRKVAEQTYNMLKKR